MEFGLMRDPKGPPQATLLDLALALALAVGLLVIAFV